MSHVAIDPARADAAAAALDDVARRDVPAPPSRSLIASSSLAAAVNLLEQRLVALDELTGTHLTTQAIEIRSAGEAARLADR